MTKRDYEKNLVQRDFNLEVKEVEKEEIVFNNITVVWP